MDGIQIGDVGVVDPVRGFDVLFNVCKPDDHPLHARWRDKGFPKFDPIRLHHEDISIEPDAIAPGTVISSGVTRTPSRPSARYEFTPSSSEGAILVIPLGAVFHELIPTDQFRDLAIQHATNWHKFAVRCLQRPIGNDSLCIITGFYKARCWSLASFKDANVRDDSQQLWLTKVEEGYDAGNYNWEHSFHVDWRDGPRRGPIRNPNQCVFLRGFKIAMRGDVFGRPYVTDLVAGHESRVDPLAFLKRRSGAKKRPGTASDEVELLHDEIAQLNETNKELRRDLAQSQSVVKQNAQAESSKMNADDEITQLRQANHELRRDLVKSQSVVDEQKEQTESWKMKANDEIMQLRQANDKLHHDLVKSQHAADEREAQIESWKMKPNSEIVQLGQVNDKLRQDLVNSQHAVDEQKEQIQSWRMEANDEITQLKQANDKLRHDLVTIVSEVVEIFHQVPHELRDTDASDKRTQWQRGFQGLCVEKLVNLADAARDGKKHEEAIQYYSDAISLDPTNLHELLLKRSNELIELGPLSYTGYEEKHMALHAMGRYNEAFEAFQAMLSIFERSHDPKIHELRHRFVDATSAIREEVWEAIRHLPTVLIDADTGRLYDKTQQAAAFEELPIYDELRSSMTTTLDHSRIRKEVTNFYRYVMFSHKWQLGEPTFQRIENDSVYSLPSSPTFDKLRNFCKLVVALQYKWAWSDTCCVNQLDKGVQQESIVAMFRWYRRSSLTVVHLLGVLSKWQEPGCLWKSIWNTRGWTYQEYVASEIVQFYTEDWKPYLSLEMFNHKESPTVLSEMERAMNVATPQLITLQPGLDRAREKLYLASGRQTTREEDMAYSLFGIFGVALPVVYGEGNLAVGRLLEHILTRSAEVTLLAWTGHPGSHHSYLPASLTVYNEIVPPHVPAPIKTSEMNQMVSSLHSSFSNPSLVVTLYQRLYGPRLSLVGGHLSLPGILFQLGELAQSDVESGVRVYRTTTPLLGDIEIKTASDLSEMSDLCLIHPWISPLIDQDFSRGRALFDPPTRALRLLVRLRQPFSGLLLALSGREQYRRVATDSLIMVQVREEAPLSELMDAVCTVNMH